MKRNYKYEKEMLHWLDGGEIEQKCEYIGNEYVTKEWWGKWLPFDGNWMDDVDWQYRIAEPKEKPKEERWLYVVVGPYNSLHLSDFPTIRQTIGKIRMEDV